MKKVRIEFTDGSKVVAVVEDTTLGDGVIELNLSTSTREHSKCIPLCTIACIDVTFTDDTEVSYDKA